MTRFCHSRLVLMPQDQAKTLTGIGGPYKIRTCDTVVKSHLLYQLS